MVNSPWADAYFHGEYDGRGWCDSHRAGRRPGATRERDHRCRPRHLHAHVMIAKVPPAGFEPATHGLGNRRSIP